MNPIDEEHVSYIVYEPTSGSIVRNAKVCFEYKIKFIGARRILVLLDGSKSDF